MAAGGLGRTLADIRADLDLEAAEHGDHLAGNDAGTRTRSALRRILSGAATEEPPEFGTPTPAQWWAARLLTLEPDVRLAAIARLLAAADHAAECWRLDHDGRYQLLERRYFDLLRAVKEGEPVEILLADDVPVGWVLA